MPLKQAVDDYKRHEEQRRFLTELRILYGNARSDSNLRRPLAKFKGRLSSIGCPVGRTSPPSWQMSRSQAKPKVTPNPAASKSNTLDEETYAISRRYDMLQRQTARQAKLYRTHLKKVEQPARFVFIN